MNNSNESASIFGIAESLKKKNYLAVRLRGGYPNLVDYLNKNVVDKLNILLFKGKKKIKDFSYSKDSKINGVTQLKKCSEHAQECIKYLKQSEYKSDPHFKKLVDRLNIIKQDFKAGSISMKKSQLLDARNEVKSELGKEKNRFYKYQNNEKIKSLDKTLQKREKVLKKEQSKKVKNFVADLEKVVNSFIPEELDGDTEAFFLTPSAVIEPWPFKNDSIAFGALESFLIKHSKMFKEGSESNEYLRKLYTSLSSIKIYLYNWRYFGTMHAKYLTGHSKKCEVSPPKFIINVKDFYDCLDSIINFKTSKKIHLSRPILENKTVKTLFKRLKYNLKKRKFDNQSLKKVHDKMIQYLKREAGEEEEVNQKKLAETVSEKTKVQDVFKEVDRELEIFYKDLNKLVNFKSLRKDAPIMKYKVVVKGHLEKLRDVCGKIRKNIVSKDTSSAIRQTQGYLEKFIEYLKKSVSQNDPAEIMQTISVITSELINFENHGFKRNVVMALHEWYGKFADWLKKF